MKPRLFVEQKITAFTNKYKIFDAQGDEQGGLVGFAQQKRLAFKEKVSFYSDETETSAAFTFHAEKVLDVHGRYLVEDNSGVVIGMFKKEFKKSLLNSTWIVMDADGKELFMIQESSTALALFRRYASILPIIGELIEIATNFLKYHFVFTKVNSEEVVGTYQKTKLFRDHYTLSMNDEAFGVCDWRVFAAMSVGLDALQSR